MNLFFLVNCDVEIFYQFLQNLLFKSPPALKKALPLNLLVALLHEITPDDICLNYFGSKYITAFIFFWLQKLQRSTPVYSTKKVFIQDYLQALLNLKVDLLSC